MKLFPPPLVVGNTEGFTAENDLFGRKPIAEGMTNLLKKVSSPLTVAVDGQWGSGKTVFLKMWAGELRKQNIPVAYFDAFANDHNEDAFSAIAQNLISLARDSEPKISSTTRNFVAAAENMSRMFASAALKTTLRVATQGMLDATTLQRVAETAKEQAGTVTDAMIDNLLREQEAKASRLLAFRQALEQLPALLSKQDKSTPALPPLIVIVDELDRCRPTFAVELLECIKHFFTVHRTHFVLGLHTGQLLNSIRAVYGPGIDAAQYLEKFIHLNVFLTGEPRSFQDLNIVKYVLHWKRQMEIPPALSADFDDAVQLIIHIAESRSLEIRSIQRILSNLTLAITTAPQHWFREPILLAGLSVLKSLHPEAYKQAKAGTLIFEDAKRLLALDQSPREELEAHVRQAVFLWEHCTGANVSPELSIQWRVKFRVQSRQELPYLVSQILDFWGERAPPLR